MRKGSIASALTSTIGKAAKQLTPKSKKKKTSKQRHRRSYSSCSSSSSSVDNGDESNSIISSVSCSSMVSHASSSASHSSCSEYSYSYDPSRDHPSQHSSHNRHHHHHHRKDTKHRRRRNRKRHKRRPPRHCHRDSSHYCNSINPHDDDTDRMIDLLMRIIPFYGQGDKGSDNVVIDTIHRLPSHALEMRDVDGNTLLLITCQGGAFGLLPTLLSKGCDVNARNNVGASSLHYACFAETFSPEAAMTLVRHGAVAEVIETEFGCTPLHWAAYHGHVELCRVLCRAGANPRTIDKNGCDPISYSRDSGKDTCTQLLESYLERKRNVITSLQEDKSDWIRCMDENMNSFYHNKETGESLWGDDFRCNIEEKKYVKEGSEAKEEIALLKQSSDVHVEKPKNVLPTDENMRQADEGVEDPKPAKSQSLERGNENGKRPTVARSNSCDEELVEIKKKGESATNQAAVNASSQSQAEAMSSKNENIMNTKQFEDRLSVLHEKLNNRLESLEKKMVWHKQQEEAQTNDANVVLALKNDLAAIKTTTLDLRTQIGQKDLEILSLKQQIVMHETKIYAKPRTYDVSVGVELTVDDNKSDQMSNANEENKRQQKEAQDEISKLRDQVRKMNTEINDTASRWKETEKLLQIAEEKVRDEKASRESLMRLFEQAKEGQEVGSDLTQSLHEEKQRAETAVNELRQQLQDLEKEWTTREHSSQEELLAQKEQTDRLANELQQVTAAHITEIAQLGDQYREENERSIDNLIQCHRVELQKVHDQLREETLSRMEMEASKYEAIAAMEMAQEKARLTLATLHEMTDLINSSKNIEKNNEQLNLSLQKETEMRKALHNTIEDIKGRIRVYVRIRPLSELETRSDFVNVMTKEDDRTIAMAADATSEARAWEFDKIFFGASEDGNTQEAVFKDTSLLITSAIDGFNVCIFAYGQTGSGKTYTMFGASGEVDESQTGLAFRVASDLFAKLRERESSCDVEVEVSMLELYNDKLCDLLPIKQNENDSVVEIPTLKIRLAEHTSSGLVEVDGLTMEQVTNATQLLDVFNRGACSRTSASTKMNADSSRSHMIASIVVCLRNRRSGNVIRGKLTLVDLAGSERVSKSGATGEQLKEAQSINKSLSALGDVIGALTSGSQHVPYRNNPLTMLMSDSIGGNAKTLMFVCCSPSNYNQKESQQSLDFAKRCRNVRNNAQRSSTVQQLTQIRALRAELSKIKTKQKGGTVVKRPPMGGMRRPGL